MKGIKIFLVTKEDGKPSCRMEIAECEYNENIKYDIMVTFSKNKEGISLVGKFDEREAIERKLKCYHKNDIEDRLNKLKEELRLLNSLK